MCDQRKWFLFLMQLHMNMLILIFNSLYKTPLFDINFRFCAIISLYNVCVLQL